MNGHGRWIIGMAAMLASWSLVLGSGSHRSVPVPPDHEIEVLDPNVDPLGRPAVKLCKGPDGQVQVDIPQAVIVHRYYYTGDRKFQAQFLPGGPCIVVASNPHTGEREYIQVNMVPGAPKVTYTCHAIEYDYGEQGITVSFCRVLHKTKVEYRRGRTMAARTEKVATKAKEVSKKLATRTGLTEARKKLVEGTKNVTVTVIDRGTDLVKMALTPIKAAVGFIPGAKMLTSPPEDRAARLREQAVGAATAQQPLDNQFIDTNR